MAVIKVKYTAKVSNAAGNFSYKHHFNACVVASSIQAALDIMQEKKGHMEDFVITQLTMEFHGDATEIYIDPSLNFKG